MDRFLASPWAVLAVALFFIAVFWAIDRWDRNA